ncbi:MAG TPA: SGNH/GDSL hydrolase family protein [Candidatus Dormibacteraeota bacterium]|nr:SGNH/GDSL hydrolase family protein [Candidatus Dormibacteraeota bacterium]
MRLPRRAVAGTLTLLAAAACGLGGHAAPDGAAAAVPPIVYAALGSVGTAGTGNRGAGASFPRLLYERLPSSAVLYDLALPHETTAAALDDELPQALAARPALVTVWFGPDDLVAGVTATAYEQHLDRLVKALRRNGAATVLVGRGPPLDGLPAIQACLPTPPTGPAKCPFGSARPAPPPDQLAAQAAAYDAAAERVAARQGAILVDLTGLAPTTGQQSDYAGSDGLHPGLSGAAGAAAAFAAALPASLTRESQGAAAESRR